MNSSPLVRVLSRHICSCRTSHNVLRTNARSFTAAAVLRDQHWTPNNSTYGSSELLKRKYQNRPEELDKSQLKVAAYKKRMRYSAYGIVACAVGLCGTIFLYPQDQSKHITHLDAPAIPGLPDTSLDEEKEQVPTGTSTVPFFPRTLQLSEVAASRDEAITDQEDHAYQLVGLGIRKVMYIQVYVVGLYVAVADIAKLQERLVHTVNPIATTLVPGEKAELRKRLLDPAESEEIWNAVLREGGIRTVFRIVPTRNTDFAHLRDGWTRGVTSKTQAFSSRGETSFSDETFGVALNEFKTALGGGFSKKVPWGETVLLTRDGDGLLNSWYEDKNGNKLHLGAVKDERISRLLWLIYLGGAKVSTEELRKNVVEGVMEYVERPIGTVATQVV